MDYRRAHLRYRGIMWGFPKIRGTILGGPNNKDYSIWGFILGPPILGNYHISLFRDNGKQPVKMFTNDPLRQT